MGNFEDFETSLQVLRGFDTDISLEINEIKVNQFMSWLFSDLQLFWTFNLLIKCVFTCSLSRNLWDHRVKKLLFIFLSLREGDTTILCWYTCALYHYVSRDGSLWKYAWIPLTPVNGHSNELVLIICR